jgi:2-polyprenyl-3-methyl-5-hydroxy-6-metoxy-1,4-benzoquinol methylase
MRGYQGTIRGIIKGEGAIRFGGKHRGNLFKNWIGRGKKVLDLGCRDGALSRFYREGNEIIGVDIDREALRICQERSGIETFCLNLNDLLPFEASSFDVVVAGEVIEHLYYPEFFLEEVARVLKPEGRFIGSTCNAFRLRNRRKFLLGKEYEDNTHLHRSW